MSFDTGESDRRRKRTFGKFSDVTRRRILGTSSRANSGHKPVARSSIEEFQNSSTRDTRQNTTHFETQHLVANAVPNGRLTTPDARASRPRPILAEIASRETNDFGTQSNSIWVRILLLLHCRPTLLPSLCRAHSGRVGYVASGSIQLARCTAVLPWQESSSPFLDRIASRSASLCRAVGRSPIACRVFGDQPGRRACHSAGNLTRIFDIDDSITTSNLDVSISGLTLTGGNAFSGGEGVPEDGDGGAIRSQENLTLVDSVITGNTAERNGGGAATFSAYGTTTVSNTAFSNNSAAQGGGFHGYGSDEGNLSLSNTVFTGNSAVQNGGGLHLSAGNYGSVSLTGSTISGNTSGQRGDGIFSSTYGGGQTLFDSNTVTGNTATIPGGLDHPGNYGGGIYALADSGSALTLSNSTVSSNFGGGVNFLVSYGSDGEISDSVVSGNTGSTIDSGGGGGIEVTAISGATMTIQRTLISGNVVGGTAGVSGPFPFGGGAGIASYAAVGVANNADLSGTAPDVNNEAEVTYSLIGNDSGSTLTVVGAGNQIGTSGALIDPMLGDVGRQWRSRLSRRKHPVDAHAIAEQHGARCRRSRHHGRRGDRAAV